MMRRFIGCTFAAGFALFLASTSFARMNGDVKASPLYKQSLEQSIAKMETKGDPDPKAGQVQLAAANIPTGANICPNAYSTAVSTCQPSYCGGSTCQTTCSATCTNTCEFYATCAATCSGTCANTCMPGACTNYNFNGYVYGYDQSGHWVGDWNFTWGFGAFDVYWHSDGVGGYVDAGVNDPTFPSTISYAQFDQQGAYSFSKACSSNASSYSLEAGVLVDAAEHNYYCTGRSDVNSPPSSTSGNSVEVDIPNIPD